MKKLGQKGFTLVEGLLVVIALSLVTGVGYYVYNANKVADKNLATTQAPPPNIKKSKPIEKKKQYLEIKELGIKMEVTEANKDAYYFFVHDVPYLSVHYFDNIKGFEGCTASGGDGDGGGVAAISRAKVGDDHFGSPWTEAELKDREGVNIDGTYYWVEPRSQAPCWDMETVSENDPNVEKVSNYKKAFTDQQQTITKI